MTLQIPNQPIKADEQGSVHTIAFKHTNSSSFEPKNHSITVALNQISEYLNSFKLSQYTQ